MLFMFNDRDHCLCPLLTSIFLNRYETGEKWPDYNGHRYCCWTVGGCSPSRRGLLDLFEKIQVLNSTLNRITVHDILYTCILYVMWNTCNCVICHLYIGQAHGKLERRRMDQQRRAKSWKRIRARKQMCNAQRAVQGEGQILFVIHVQFSSWKCKNFTKCKKIV